MVPPYTAASMLRRYFLREALSLYLVGFLIFVGLLTSDFFTSWAGAFARMGTPVQDMLLLWLYRMPYFLGVALAFGLVFALLITLARWIRQSELKAMYAGGVRPMVLLLPVLGVGAVVSGLALFTWGWLRPEAQLRFDALKDRIFYGSSPSGVLTDQLYTPQGYGLYYAERVYPDTDGSGVRLDNVRVVEPGGAVWSAPRGRWLQAGVWQLEDARRVEPDGRVTVVGSHPLPFPLSAPPPTDSYDAINLTKLHEVARADGRAVFPLAQRYANALGALVLAWLAMAVGLRLREQSWAFVAVVVLLFGYYTLWTLSAKFAEYDLFGPVVAAWMPNLIFGAVAAVLTLRLR